MQHGVHSRTVRRIAMPDIKVTTWNIEHFGKLLAATDGASAVRKDAITRTIRRVDPDILCVVEGPGDLRLLQDYAANDLNGDYVVPLIDGTTAILDTNPADVRHALADLYAMRGTTTTGNQWIWFLVRSSLAAAAETCEMQPPAVWQSFVGSSSWKVHYWGDMSTTTHRHWRHPQVLLLDLDGARTEFIGVHLKSKINRTSPRDEAGELRREYRNSFNSPIR